MSASLHGSIPAISVSIIHRNLLDFTVRFRVSIPLSPYFAMIHPRPHRPRPLALVAAVLFALPHFLSPAQLSAEEKAPSWIWAAAKPGGKDTVYFRKNFEVPATATRVLLVAAADNGHDTRVNGEKRPVLRGSEWNKPGVADITSLVKKGAANLVAVRAKNSGGAAGFIALIEITDGDGSKTRIVSGSDWKAASRGQKNWHLPDTALNQKLWKPAAVLAPAGKGPWGEKVTAETLAAQLDIRIPQATAVEDIRLPEGFRAELLYSVPKADQGSWVAMTLDDQERLIVSDQYGSLYRFPVPASGETLSPGDIEKIDLDIGGAQGLLYAFDALYCVLNTPEHGGRGLYRLRDSDGDDRFDEKKLLRKFEEVGGEHGPHAVLLGPDGKSIYVVVGNQTPLTEVDTSRVPQVWDEDLLLERPIGKGFMKGTPAPGGWIAKTDPDGEEWELIATGFRNEYDAAFDAHGELFTFDADMEWDMNTPWYRPTRVNHVVSGAEFGWRNGGGKWPATYPDSVGAVVNIGPGSPTGVAFGYGAKFPAKYQNAFYIADWSYGKLYAVHLEPEGASYRAEFEEFMSAQPLPLTDLVVNPGDGALYIAIGGRRVQSGLYRVTYTGDESTEPAAPAEPGELFALREKLEAHHRENPAALDLAWPQLGHEDRAIRYAARIAVEHQPVESWKERALAEKDPVASIHALIALARHGSSGGKGEKGDRALQEQILAALDRIDWEKLDNGQRLDLTRAWALAFTRLGEGSEKTREALATKLDAVFPAATPELNAELLQLLVYLQAPSAAEKGMALLREAPSQEEQMSYAKSLRHLRTGWTRELRGEFFEWFARAAGYKGGASFSLFIENMKKTALENTPKADRVALKDVIEAKPPEEPTFTAEPREFVKAWTVADFDDVINVGLEGGRDFANGRKMFGAAQCFSCHRFNQEGGAIGPDLTSAGGKFSPRDLLESIIEPSKEISDQYGQMIFTMKDGSQVFGRIMNLNGDTVRVNTNMLDPDAITMVDRKQLVEMKESPMSMMPPGLVNTLEKDDVLDLLAFLLSRGQADDPMFAE